MENYMVKDLYEASYIYAQGLKLHKVQRSGRIAWFVFGAREECEPIANLYWSGEGQVSGRKYADAIRTLKDRLFANK